MYLAMRMLRAGLALEWTCYRQASPTITSSAKYENFRFHFCGDSIVLDIQNTLPLHKAIREATGTNPHFQTGRRWVREGNRGIRLEAVLVNGEYRTTVQAVRDFIEATTQARLQTNEPVRIEVQKPVRPKRVDQAVKEFRKLSKAK